MPEIESVALITGLTIMITELLVADDDEKQPPTGIVITHEMTSLFANAVVLYVELLVPTFVEFLFHWKVPPVTLVIAVNVTFAPAQTVVFGVEILIVGGTGAFTVMERLLLKTVLVE